MGINLKLPMNQVGNVLFNDALNTFYLWLYGGSGHPGAINAYSARSDIVLKASRNELLQIKS